MRLNHNALSEWDVRVQLAAAYRLVAHFGWDDLANAAVLGWPALIRLLDARRPGFRD